jgi:hypothetical protein
MATPKDSRWTPTRLAEVQRFSQGVGLVLVGISAVLSLYTGLWLQAGWTLRSPWSGGIGLLILVLGVVAPTTLDVPERLWMRMAHFLGYWNTRILLTLVYFLIVSPMGLIARLLGWDKLRLRRPDGESFYQEPPEFLANSKHFEHPF